MLTAERKFAALRTLQTETRKYVGVSSKLKVVVKIT